MYFSKKKWPTYGTVSNTQRERLITTAYPCKAVASEEGIEESREGRTCEEVKEEHNRDEGANVVQAAADAVGVLREVEGVKVLEGTEVLVLQKARSALLKIGRLRCRAHGANGAMTARFGVCI